jgi:hypothetical protein
MKAPGISARASPQGCRPLPRPGGNVALTGHGKWEICSVDCLYVRSKEVSQDLVESVALVFITDVKSRAWFLSANGM